MDTKYMIRPTPGTHVDNAQRENSAAVQEHSSSGTQKAETEPAHLASDTEICSD